MNDKTTAALKKYEDIKALIRSEWPEERVRPLRERREALHQALLHESKRAMANPFGEPEALKAVRVALDKCICPEEATYTKLMDQMTAAKDAFISLLREDEGDLHDRAAQHKSVRDLHYYGFPMGFHRIARLGQRVGQS